MRGGGGGVGAGVKRNITSHLNVPLRIFFLCMCAWGGGGSFIGPRPKPRLNYVF